MVEIELVRRRGLRRTVRRVVRRRGDLVLVGLVALVVLATATGALVLTRPTSGPVDRAGREPATATRLPGLPATGDGPSTSDGRADGGAGSAGADEEPAGSTGGSVEGSSDGTDARATGPSTRDAGDETAGQRTGLGPGTAVTETPAGPGQGPPPTRDGALTRTVDPVLARLATTVPLLEPVRAVVREVTRCADATLGPSEPGGCP